jgi:hypothetical protein
MTPNGDGMKGTTLVAATAVALFGFGGAASAQTPSPSRDSAASVQATTEVDPTGETGITTPGREPAKPARRPGKASATKPGAGSLAVTSTLNDQAAGVAADPGPAATVSEETGIPPKSSDPNA